MSTMCYRGSCDISDVLSRQLSCQRCVIAAVVMSTMCYRGSLRFYRLAIQICSSGLRRLTNLTDRACTFRLKSWPCNQRILSVCTCAFRVCVCVCVCACACACACVCVCFFFSCNVSSLQLSHQRLKIAAVVTLTMCSCFSCHTNDVLS